MPRNNGIPVEYQQRVAVNNLPHDKILSDRENMQVRKSMQDHKTKLLRDIDKIEKDGILNKEAIGFYSDIFDFQSRMHSRWNELTPFPETCRDANTPIDSSSLRLDGKARELLTLSFAEICEIIHRHNEGIDLSRAKETVTSDTTFFDTIIDHILKKNTDALYTMAEDARMGFEEYLFLTVNWLKPLFTALRGRYAGTKVEEYKDRTCPFCGYYPDMGLFAGEKEGRRFLRCGLCENVWMFRRISCAICGETDAKNLEYYIIENNERYRVDACQSCKGYIKSVRLEKFDTIESCDLTVENLLTMSLDAEMMNKGYGKL